MSTKSCKLLIHTLFPLNSNGRFDSNLTSHSLVNKQTQKYLSSNQTYIPAPGNEEKRYPEILSDIGLKLLDETKTRIKNGDCNKHGKINATMVSCHSGNDNSCFTQKTFFDRQLVIFLDNGFQRTSTYVILRTSNWVLTMSGTIHVFNPEDVKKLLYCEEGKHIPPEYHQFYFN